MASQESIQAEQGIIDAFCEYYRAFSTAKGSTGHSFSVGARDRLVAGDYIITSDSHFSLVEFKWSENGQKAERAKKISNLLCPTLRLPKNAKMLARANRCHRIAWHEGDQVKFAGYFDYVCCGKLQQKDATDFCAEWFTPPPQHRVNYADFQAYIDWLLALTESPKSELLLIAGNHVYDQNGLPDLRVVKCYGIAELKIWLDDHRPKPPTVTRRETFGM